MLLLGMFNRVDKPVMNMYLRPIIDGILCYGKVIKYMYIYTQPSQVLGGHGCCTARKKEQL